MKLIPRSFLARTILMILVPMSVLLIVVGQAFFGNHWSRVQREMSHSLSGEISTLIKVADKDPELARRVAQGMGINMTENERLNRPAKTDNASHEIGHFDEILTKKLGGAKARIYMDKPARLLFVDIPVAGGKTTTFATSLRRVYSSSTSLFVLFIILALVGVSILTAPFIILHNRSIRQVARAATKFGRGMSMPGFAPSGSREIREAGAALVMMKARLDRYNKTRSDMLNAVSHDLKSPLARMRIAIESGTETKDQLVSDIDRMTEMVNGYLAFARGEVPELEQAMSLAPMLTRIARDSGAADKIKLNLPDESTEFYARPNAIMSAITNLIANAVRYAKKKIEITEIDGPEEIEITIDDDGPGIPADRRADAMTPFVRLDPARGTATGGSGLGLNIAQNAVENHGGQLFLEDSPLGGLRVRIVLPI
jgi:two-component system osmolarity sensor histidine kinase EnvZ